MKPTVVGLIVAGLYVLFKMALYFTGQQYDIMFGKAAMILIALVMLGIFYSINFYIRNSDTYDWMAAFKKGITVSLISSAVVGVFLFIYYKAIDSFYLDQLMVNEYNRMESMIPKDKVDDFNKGLKERYTANMFAIMTVSIVNIVGLFSSLIVAFLGRMTVKRKTS